LLPTLSRLSVSTGPGDRLPHWCSARSLRISPLHRAFRHPLPASSHAVYLGRLPLSGRMSPSTYIAACARCTPSKSGQRLPPLSYRGCWHRVSRGLFARYCPYHPSQKEFTTRRPSSSTRRCSVRLAPIAEDSLLLPPVGVWAVSQSQSGWPSSQTSDPSKAWWAITPPST
jgi:hypothetical protein